MKKCILLLIAAIPFLLQAQVALFVGPSTSLSIKPATIFFAAGLTLVPGSTYTLSNVTLRKNTSLTHASANTSISRSYYFNNTTPAFSGTVQVDYQTAELNGLTELLLQPNIHNGTGWQAYPSSLIDAVHNYVVSGTFSSTSLSEITLASVSTPLPLAWGNISASRKGQANEIRWSTDRENNADHFDVEYSVDSKNWSLAIRGIAASHVFSVHQYTRTDPVYKPQYLLYRIAETDADGRVSYSAAVSLAAVDQDQLISIYPNPVSDRFYISRPQPDEVASVTLFSSNGMQVKRWPEGQATYPVTGLAHGVYIVSIKTKAGQSQSSRLVIR